MLNKKSLLISAALSGLMAASTYAGVPGIQMAGESPVGQCHGVNACKGKGSCQGVGHECSGKNACEGKGWVKLSQKVCEQIKDGKWAPMPKKS